MAEKEKKPEDQPAPPDTPKRSDGLIKMQKGSETTKVHPTTVKSHENAGWKKAE